jgi:hypothetical protein
MASPPRKRKRGPVYRQVAFYLPDGQMGQVSEPARLPGIMNPVI